MTIERKQRFLVNTAFVAVIAVLFYFAMKYLTMLFLPFVIGFICALVLQKPIAFLSEKTRIPRALWSFILVGAILSVLVGLLVLAGYGLYAQASDLIENLTQGTPAIESSLADLSSQFEGFLNKLPQGLADSLRSSSSSFVGTGVEFLSGLIADFAAGAFMSLPALILTTVISIVACCFITADYYKITNFILCQFTEDNQRLILKTKRVFVENILKMLRGYGIIICITFLELFVGLLILGIPYTATIALLIAVVDILPVLGTGAVLIPWALVDFCVGKPGTGVGLLLLYVFIIVVRNIIEPKIIGKQVGLPAIVTLIAIYIGLNLFGLYGVFVLPVIIIVLAKLQEADMIHIWKTGHCVSAAIVRGEEVEEMEHLKNRKKQKEEN